MVSLLAIVCRAPCQIDAVLRQRKLRGILIRAWVPIQDVDILRSHPATGGRPGPARFNQVVYCRGFLFLAGQIVYDTSSPGMDTYYGQAKKVLHQVGQLLEDSGSCMERVLQASPMHPSICFLGSPGNALHVSGCCMHSLGRWNAQAGLLLSLHARLSSASFSGAPHPIWYIGTKVPLDLARGPIHELAQVRAE